MCIPHSHVHLSYRIVMCIVNVKVETILWQLCAIPKYCLKNIDRLTRNQRFIQPFGIPSSIQWSWKLKTNPVQCSWNPPMEFHFFQPVCFLKLPCKMRADTWYDIHYMHAQRSSAGIISCKRSKPFKIYNGLKSLSGLFEPWKDASEGVNIPQREILYPSGWHGDRRNDRAVP